MTAAVQAGMALLLVVPVTLIFALVVAGMLIGPGVVAVRWLVENRAVGFLIRGSLERACIYGVGLGTCVALIVQAGLLAADDPWFGVALLGLAAPPLLAVAPWVTGEVLSGPSERPMLALAASLATSTLVSWSAVFVAVSGPHLPRLPLHCAIAGATAVLSSAAYLHARGRALDPASPTELPDTTTCASRAC
jgi:hypothetical protein